MRTTKMNFGISTLALLAAADVGSGAGAEANSLDDSSEAGFSLASLAAFNTDEISTLTSRVPAAGVYTVLITDIKAEQVEPKESGQDVLITFTYEYEILSATLFDKSIDAETLVGRNLKERYTFWPNSLVEQIGLLKGRYQKVGFVNTGLLGGDGITEGWVDSARGAQIDISIRNSPHKTTGEMRAYFDWPKVPTPAVTEAD